MSVQALLEQSGIECEDNTIILSRQIFSDGKSRAYINAHAVNLSLAWRDYHCFFSGRAWTACFDKLIR